MVGENKTKKDEMKVYKHNSVDLIYTYRLLLFNSNACSREATYHLMFGKDNTYLKKTYSLGIISRFIHPELAGAIPREINGQHVYILGVSYPEGDIQLGMSGHHKIYETDKECISREIEEELRLDVSEDKIEILKDKERKEKRGKHSITNTFALVKISDCKTCSYRISKRQGDDRKRRAVCAVYGTEKDIIKYLNSVDRNKYNDYENNGIVAVSASLYNCISKINEAIKNIEKN